MLCRLRLKELVNLAQNRVPQLSQGQDKNIRVGRSCRGAH